LIYAHPPSIEIDESRPVKVNSPSAVKFPLTITVEGGMTTAPGAVMEPVETQCPFSQTHEPYEGGEVAQVLGIKLGLGWISTQ